MVFAQKGLGINWLPAAEADNYDRASSLKAELILRSSLTRKSDHIPTRKLSVDNARTCSCEPGLVYLKSMNI